MQDLIFFKIFVNGVTPPQSYLINKNYLYICLYEENLRFPLKKEKNDYGLVPSIDILNDLPNQQYENNVFQTKAVVLCTRR